MTNSSSPLRKPRIWHRALLRRACERGTTPAFVAGEFLPLMHIAPPPPNKAEAAALSLEFDGRWTAEEIQQAFTPTGGKEDNPHG